jgi:transcriptional regulator with XRE-family HTH domain
MAKRAKKVGSKGTKTRIAPEGAGEPLGERLRRLLLAKGYTQTSLAKKAGLERTDLNRIINGHRNPHQRELPWLAEALDLSVDALLAGAEVPHALREIMAEHEDDEVAKVESALRRVLDAESQRDEAIAKAAATQEERETERKQWEESRAGLQRKLDDLTVRLRTEQERSRDDISKLEADVRTKDDRIAELSRSGAADATTIKTLRSQIADLQQRIAQEGGKTLVAGVLSGLAGLVSGAALNAPSTRRRY